MAEPNPSRHGLLVVDKPGLVGDPAVTLSAGQPTERLLTSHDVVQRVRRWSGQRRIGHTGTLDPLASGVLVLCLGDATRLVEYYQRHDKHYAAEIVLGVATDSYDAAGQVTAVAPVPSLDRTQIEQALASLRGDIWQTPPVFSALKQGGEALYRKARRGETVTVAPRPVTFHRLELIDWRAPRLKLALHCSAGAYIRSLAHDLAMMLGTVGHLAALRRECAGPFTLAESHTLDAIQAAAERNHFADLLLPPGWGLGLPQLYADMQTLTRLGHGQTVALDMPGAPGELAQVRGANGRLAGIAICRGPSAGGVLWKAEKWFTNT